MNGAGVSTPGLLQPRSKKSLKPRCSKSRLHFLTGNYIYPLGALDPSLYIVTRGPVQEFLQRRGSAGPAPIGVDWSWACWRWWEAGQGEGLQ